MHFWLAQALNYNGGIEGISAASVSPQDVPKSNLLSLSIDSVLGDSFYVPLD